MILYILVCKQRGMKCVYTVSEYSYSTVNLNLNLYSSFRSSSKGVLFLYARLHTCMSRRNTTTALHVLTANTVRIQYTTIPPPRYIVVYTVYSCSSTQYTQCHTHIGGGGLGWVCGVYVGRGDEGPPPPLSNESPSAAWPPASAWRASSECREPSRPRLGRA